MDDQQAFLQRLARGSDTKIVLLVLDGVGDLRTSEQGETALERAKTPRLDAVAATSSLGRLVPVATGITPGSGPGHLALFGHDPRRPEVDIGRGVLEALGLGLEVSPRQVAARGNFATADADGNLTDRRAGRIPTAECERLAEVLNRAIAAADLDFEAAVHAGEGHRFVLLLSGENLHADLADTDPQRLGVPPLAAAPLPSAAEDPVARSTAEGVNRLIAVLDAALADEPQANRALLRGFSRPPHLPSFEELYRLRAGAFAGYPLYRGVAGACGMEVVPCERQIGQILSKVGERWDDFDFFFIHVKQTDAAGEDGDLQAKTAVIEDVDRELEHLLALGPDVLAVTADHSTPSPMAAHSWHPVPLLVHSRHAFIDRAERFTELEAIHGTLGTLPARDLMAVLLAHAGRLAKFGA